MGELTQFSEEAIHSQRLIKSFSGEQWQESLFEQVNERNRRLHLKMAAALGASTPIVVGQRVVAQGELGDDGQHRRGTEPAHHPHLQRRVRELGGRIEFVFLGQLHGREFAKVPALLVILPVSTLEPILRQLAGPGSPAPWPAP